jgi:PleD family two-component response regulator
MNLGSNRWGRLGLSFVVERTISNSSFSRVADESSMAQEVVGKPSQHSAAIGCLTAKVLVVDDDKHFRALARVILEQGGYEVIESENVQQSMLQLRCDAVDALILDMFMPDLNGLQALAG